MLPTTWVSFFHYLQEYVKQEGFPGLGSEKLTHLIYTSAIVPAFEASQLSSVLHVARINNARHAITGMLLYIAGNFFQVLEGDEVALTKLFAIITADTRHTNVTKIIHEPIAHRDFGDWTMGFSSLDLSEVESGEGLNDFFQQGTSLANLESGRAKKLLSAFAQGRWRMRLEAGA